MRKTKIRIENQLHVYLAVTEGGQDVAIEVPSISYLDVSLNTQPKVSLEVVNLDSVGNTIQFDILAPAQIMRGDYYITMKYKREDGSMHSLKKYAFTLVDLSNQQYTGTDVEVPSEVFVNAAVYVNIPPESLRPHIGENGNWYIGDTDTGVPATGPAGQNGVGVTSIVISPTGDVIVTYSNGQTQNAGNIYSDDFVTQDQLDLIVNNIQSQITLNQTAISNLSTDVDSLREQVNNRTHFRGTYQTTDSVLAITDPLDGDEAYNLETLTRWLYTTSDLPALNAPKGLYFRGGRAVGVRPIDTSVPVTLDILFQTAEKITGTNYIHYSSSYAILLIIVNGNLLIYTGANSPVTVSAVEPNIRYHLVVSMDGTSATAYLNGIESATSTITQAAAPNFALASSGVSVNANSFLGVIYMFRWFSGSATPDDALALWNNGDPLSTIGTTIGSITIEDQWVPLSIGSSSWSDQVGGVNLTLTQPYEIVGWYDTGVGIPDTTTPLSDADPLVDGEASAGTSTQASRGDHRHPSDTSKQDKLIAGANVEIDGEIISFTIPAEVLQYDNEGNVVLRIGTKVLVTTPDNVTHEAFGLAQYTRPDGSVYFQFEVNAASSGHLNLNTNNDEVYGVKITVDTPTGKEVIVYESTLEEYKKFVELPSKYVDGVFAGITFTELQSLLEKESEGYIPIAKGVNFTNYNIIQNSGAIVLQYSYDYINTRQTDGYSELHGFIVSISSSSANTIVSPVEVMMPRIAEVPYHIPNAFLNPDPTTNTLPQVTWALIQEAYAQSLLGRVFVSNVASFYGAPRFIVTPDLASVEYDFAKVTNNELVRYHAAINATEQNVISNVIPTDYDALLSESRWVSNSGALSATTPTFDLPIGSTGLIIRARWRDAAIIDLKWLTTSGTIAIDWKRGSIYGDASQGSYGNGQNISTTEVQIDDVQSNSDDLVLINLRIAGQRYIITAFFSGGGARCDMSYHRII